MKANNNKIFNGNGFILRTKIINLGEQMNRIRWSIIGCGNVSENKSGPGFQKAG